jgi:hypothetical protein
MHATQRRRVALMEGEISSLVAQTTQREATAFDIPIVVSCLR